MSEFEGSIVVFDDVLDYTQKQIDPFFTRGRQKDSNVYYLSQSGFDLPKRTTRKNKNLLVWPKKN